MGMSKFRINVVSMAGMLTVISLAVLYALFQWINKLTGIETEFFDGVMVGMVFATCIAVATLAVASIGNVMGKIAEPDPDPAPKTVPADVHEAIVMIALSDKSQHGSVEMPEAPAHRG